MRIIASIVALALAGLTAPAALACRIAPDHPPMPIWLTPPAPAQLQPGDVVLEVVQPGYLELIDGTKADDFIIVNTCQRIERSALQIVRVLAGDARGAKFVIVPGGMAMAVAAIDPGTGMAAPMRWFVVGRLNTQDRYTVFVDDPTIGTVERTPATLTPRWPQ